MSTFELVGEQHWVCPNCDQTAVTSRGEANRFHVCPGLRGLNAPMVLDGVKCWVRVLERDEYVGQEIVHVDENGRPVAAIETVRADGSNDMAVLVPAARIIGG